MHFGETTQRVLPWFGIVGNEEDIVEIGVEGAVPIGREPFVPYFNTFPVIGDLVVSKISTAATKRTNDRETFFQNITCLYGSVERE